MAAITDPAGLGPALLDALNHGDVEAAVDLYETNACLELPDGSLARGRDQIREFYAALLADRPQFAPGEQRPALVVGNLALTTTRIGADATAEVARRQPDGTWRWVVDRPQVLGAAR